MTVSYWRRSGRLGEIQADVCVIGAGIAGTGAALWLERRGVRVVVVERHAVGAGASSRNAGFLMRGAAENYAEAVRRHGLERARDVWRLTEENLALLRAEGIEALPGYRRVPSCLVAFDEGEAGQLRNATSRLREDGFDVGWVESGGDTMWTRASPLGGLVNPHDAACQPVELLAMLRSKLRAPVVEHQEVVGIRPEGEGVGVDLTDGVVHASKVLACTNAYASTLLPGLGEMVRPKRGQMLAARKQGVRLDCSYYVNRGSEYIRQTPDGTIVVGGCRTLFAEEEVGVVDETTSQVQGAIEAFAGRVIGEGYEVVARWAGIMGFSPDGLPLVGPVEGAWASGAVWFCGGFTGHGMSMAFVTAREAAGAMIDAEVTRFPLSRVMEGAPADG